MTEQFFAQFAEDAALASMGILPAHGVFLDCGCSDPFIGSNTAFLRNRGWDGLSVDALDYSAQYEAIGAKFLRAVVSDKPTAKFLAACNPALARICDEGEEVPCMSLSEIVRKYFPSTRIDLLSLDLESGEYDALMSGQWIIPPRIIVSEYATAALDGGPDLYDYRVKDYLLQHGYELIWQSCSNHIFFKQ